MSYGIINEEHLTDIADAIRAKLGVSTTYKPTEMPNAIASISGGGITPSGTKSITANGTYDVTSYASAEVAVPTGASTLGTKSITANGTYNASDDSLDGYSSVTVNVSGGSGSSSWLPASAELVASVDETINLSSDTSWDSITPSTTTQQILAAGTTRAACSYTLTEEETANKAIIAVAHYGLEYAYTSSPGTAYEVNQESLVTGQYCMTNLSVGDYGCNAWTELNLQNYVNSSGTQSITNNASYGVAPMSPQFSVSSASGTVTTPTVGFTRRAIKATCNTDRFSTAAAALIDSANTNIVYKYRIYLVDKADHPFYACFNANSGIIK